MEIICIQGAAPGRIVATLSHGATVRQLSMTLARHRSGGWHVLRTDGGYGPRCHAVSTAVLLDASEAFAPEDGAPEDGAFENAPMAMAAE